VLVQTGSFQDPENAQYMVRDLQVSGFEAEIVEKRIGSTLYYRVVIGPPMTVDQAQTVLMKLKDASFEGVLLFPE
jgi:cell division protein FtsN